MAADSIPPEDWETIVRNVPIVSVDLVIKHEGGVLLGKRANEPAKGEWFFPGGRVHKNESRREAVHRIADKELGTSIEILEDLGTAEHFYDCSDVPGVDSKHYLSTGYNCEIVADDPDLNLDEQHSDIQVFDETGRGLHEYVREYLQRL